MWGAKLPFLSPKDTSMGDLDTASGIAANAAETTDTTKKDAAEASALEKVRQMELLPELFELLLDIELGEMQAKDFYNNLGTTRLKINNLIQRLQNLDGICDSIKDQEEQIQTLVESKSAKTKNIQQFREQVFLKLGS